MLESIEQVRWVAAGMMSSPTKTRSIMALCKSLSSPPARR